MNLIRNSLRTFSKSVRNDSASGHEAAGNKVMFKQVSNPFCIFLVSFLSTDSLNIFRMCKYNRLVHRENGNVYNPLVKATYGYVADIFSSTLGIDMKPVLIGDKKAGDYMTRGEYAELLLKLAPNILTKSTRINNLNQGDVYVAAPNLNLANLDVNGNLIITDVVGDQEVNLYNVTVAGKLIVRGGGENSISIRGNSKISEVIMKQVNENTSIKIQGSSEVDLVTVLTSRAAANIQGKIKKVALKAKKSRVVLEKAVVENVTIDGEGSNIEMKETTAENVDINAHDTNFKMLEGSSASHIDITEEAAGTVIKVSEDAVVNAVTSRADNVEVSGEGKVEYAAMEGTGSEVTTSGTIVEDKIPDELPEPTAVPTAAPTAQPTAHPTTAPTAWPTAVPTTAPAASPTPVPILSGPKLQYDMNGFNFEITCDNYYLWGV